MPTGPCEPQLNQTLHPPATRELEPCEGASSIGRAQEAESADSKCPVSEQAQIHLGCWEDFYSYFLLSYC